MADSAAGWLAMWTSRLSNASHGEEPSRTTWIPRERMRRKALQEIADAACRTAASDKRSAAEIRRAHPDGGRLVLDLLTATCTLNGTIIEPIGLVSRLREWLEHQFEASNIPPDRIRRARIEIDYTVAERNYLQRGQVWEMHYSLRSELATDGKVYGGEIPQCMASVAYGAGVSW